MTTRLITCKWDDDGGSGYYELMDRLMRLGCYDIEDEEAPPEEPDPGMPKKKRPRT